MEIFTTAFACISNGLAFAQCGMTWIGRVRTGSFAHEDAIGPLSPALGTFASSICNRGNRPPVKNRCPTRAEFETLPGSIFQPVKNRLLPVLCAFCKHRSTPSEDAPPPSRSLFSGLCQLCQLRPKFPSPAGSGWGSASQTKTPPGPWSRRGFLLPNAGVGLARRLPPVRS